MDYQTYLRGCKCKNGGILMHDGIPCCRWCRTPYDKGSYMKYEEEHFTSIKKPPLGIVPKYIYTEQRINDIQEAIKRYEDANLKYPSEWKDELHLLLLSIDNQKVPAPTKDYEILSFRDKNNDYTSILTSDEIIKRGLYSIEDYIKPTSSWNIYSVKRSLDNKIFTVRDDVNYGTIEKFYILNNHLYVDFTSGNGATLASIEHKKNI